MTRPAVGRVISVTGSKAGIGILPTPDGQPRLSATVGRFIGLWAGRSFIVAMITEATAELPSSTPSQGFDAYVLIDLMGEIRRGPDGSSRFRRGVSEYPGIGNEAVTLTAADLKLIFATEDKGLATIGTLHQDDALPACIDVEGLTSKHFALLGTTGVGKSNGMAVILNEIIALRQDLRIFLLDGHNEYGRCFGDRANIINSRNVKLPFWLFNFEEFTDVIYGGRPALAEEVEILAEVIPIAKSLYSQYKLADRAIRRKGEPRSSGYTVDTPVPYTIQGPRGPDRRAHGPPREPRRPDALSPAADPDRDDPQRSPLCLHVRERQRRRGHDGRVALQPVPPRIDRQAHQRHADGGPAARKTIDAVVCVLCRLAFDFGLWSEGAVPLLLVCEEAHRYASSRSRQRLPPDAPRPDPHRPRGPQIRRVARPRDAAAGGARFHHHRPVRHPLRHEDGERPRPGAAALGRVGRRHQPPVLRAHPRHGRGGGLRRRPCRSPVRLAFRRMPEARMPRNEAFRASGQAGPSPQHPDFIRTVVERWRGATTSGKPRQEEAEVETETSELRLLKSRLETSLFRAQPPAAS